MTACAHRGCSGGCANLQAVDSNLKTTSHCFASLAGDWPLAIPGQRIVWDQTI